MSSEDQGEGPRRLSSPRKKIMALPASGYTSDDEWALLSKELWREFIANANVLIDAFLADQDIQSACTILHKQIKAFHVLQRSTAGQLAERFFATDETHVKLRAFYIGALFQLLNPRSIHDGSPSPPLTLKLN